MHCLYTSISGVNSVQKKLVCVDDWDDFECRGRLPLPPLSRADPVVRGNPPDHPNARQVSHTGGVYNPCPVPGGSASIIIQP